MSEEAASTSSFGFKKRNLKKGAGIRRKKETSSDESGRNLILPPTK